MGIQLHRYIQIQRCGDRCMRGHIIIYTRVYVCAYARVDIPGDRGVYAETRLNGVFCDFCVQG